MDEHATLYRLMSILESGEPRGRRSEWRRRLTAWLTTRGAAEIPQEAWAPLHDLWRVESKGKPFQRAEDLPRLTSSGLWTDAVSLWRGDITRLEAGAIVNAANSGLTGCYVSFHGCVDNAIHTAAGPWLREACEQIMATRGRPEPVGTATVTRAFHLPCKYVLHTVGPAIVGGVPSDQDRDALAGCYRACLAAALELKVDSVAFCAISTGIFGYPKRDAALVSLRTIRSFFVEHDDAPHLVIVAFSESDEAVYKAAFEEMCT
jgi:O-acetyl-ADP-ribose deacetylase (regulator of RNase III)